MGGDTATGRSPRTRTGTRGSVPYPHGRYEFRGDGYHGRWVWIPYGRHPAPHIPHFPAAPVPSLTTTSR